ncbi:FtsW/RodA/SpoVE family cell cycle protein, partial [Staphylococcus aureus]|uniref:FtsW/RodA/SpoVE family cell cycle protein n=1 Tax=Staphylococcus aureus TaxID=1280 RepID=UPI0035CD2CC4
MEFLSLVIVVLAAFLTPIIVNRLHINFLPVVVAEILMGIVIGEELGFIGSVILILIFLFLIFHLISLAAKIEDQFHKIFIVGFVTSVKNTTQIVMTIAIRIGLTPFNEFKCSPNHFAKP